MQVATLPTLDSYFARRQSEFNVKCHEALQDLAHAKITRTEYVNRIWELRDEYGIWETTSQPA